MKSLTEKDAIRNLQKYLRQLSYTDSRITSPPIDGIFDSATKAALITFQKINSLPETGTADQYTWELLYDQYTASANSFAAPLKLDVFPRTPDLYQISLGDQYFLVSIIQFLFNELSIIYDDLIPLQTNGIFDENTQLNVKIFQQREGLAETGKVDKATWNGLVSAYEKYAYDYQK